MSERSRLLRVVLPIVALGLATTACNGSGGAESETPFTLDSDKYIENSGMPSFEPDHVVATLKRVDCADTTETPELHFLVATSHDPAVRSAFTVARHILQENHITSEQLAADGCSLVADLPTDKLYNMEIGLLADSRDSQSFAWAIGSVSLFNPGHDQTVLTDRYAVLGQIDVPYDGAPTFIEG